MRPNAVETRQEAGRSSRQSREGSSSHMQADRQVCAACGLMPPRHIPAALAAGADVWGSPGSYAAGFYPQSVSHKLHKPKGLLACGYCSPRG